MNELKEKVMESETSRLVSAGIFAFVALEVLSILSRKVGYFSYMHDLPLSDMMINLLFGGGLGVFVAFYVCKFVDISPALKQYTIGAIAGIVFLVIDYNSVGHLHIIIAAVIFAFGFNWLAKRIGLNQKNSQGESNENTSES